MKQQPNVYASAQNNLNASRQNDSAREKIGQITTGFTDIVDAYRRSKKYERIKGQLGNQYDAWIGNAGDKTIPEAARLASAQKAQEMQLLGEGLDSANIDSFADLYSKFTAKTPDISKLIGDQKIAELRANALKSVAAARADAQLKLQREKLLFGGGDVGGLDDSISDDATFGLEMDQSMWGN